MGNDRQYLILEMLEQKGEVQLQHLKEIFPGVSVMTLRRDLINLENEGYLIRTHGGAVSARRVASINGEEDEYARRASENIDAKMRIAGKALSLVERGRSVYFDAGSTMMCLARILPDDNFTIVTSGANIALEVLKKQKPSAICLGGFVNRNTLSVSGPDAISQLENINIDIAFMSASGFSVESGLTISNIHECELKRRVVERSKKVILLLDSGKINRNMTFTYASLEDIDIWVTDAEPSAEILAEAGKYYIQLIY